LKGKIDKWLDTLIRNLFRLLMAVVLLAGISLLLFSHYFPPGGYRHDLIRDLGMATTVSFIVTIAIEYYSAKRREADIRSGVLDAMLGKIVPQIVWEEIKANIIGKQVLCEGWHLDATLKKEKLVEEEGKRSEDQFLITATLTYTLRNQLNKKQAVLLSHELENDIKGKDSEGVDIPDFRQLAVRPSVGDAKDIKGTELRQQKFWIENMLDVPVELPAAGSVEIALQRKEAVPVPGGYPWYVNWVTVEPKITIKTDVKGIDFLVFARHPNRKALRPIITGESWVFDGVLLPGQGFEVMIKSKRSLPSADLEPRVAKVAASDGRMA
jgi:hypothetical protein